MAHTSPLFSDWMGYICSEESKNSYVGYIFRCHILLTLNSLTYRGLARPQLQFSRTVLVPSALFHHPSSHSPSKIQNPPGSKKRQGQKKVQGRWSRSKMKNEMAVQDMIVWCNSEPRQSALELKPRCCGWAASVGGSGTASRRSRHRHPCSPS